MSHLPHAIDPEALKAQVRALTVACPVTHDNPAGCPLHDLRLVPAPALNVWLISLSLDDLQKIITRHNLCLHTREFLQCFD